MYVSMYVFVPSFFRDQLMTLTETVFFRAYTNHSGWNEERDCVRTKESTTKMESMD